MNELNTPQQPPNEIPPATSTPPGGVYPAPSQPLAFPAPAPAPQKGHRVGTFTLALCLIATGALLLLRIFLPSINIFYLLQFAPLALVLLGAEILIANFIHKDGKLRYDVLSIFIGFLLVGGSLFAASLPTLWRIARGYYGISSGLSYQLEQEAFEILKDTKQVASLKASIEFDEWGDYTAVASLDKLPLNSAIHINVELAGPYATKEEFAEACQQVQSKLKNLPVAPNMVNYRNFNDRVDYATYQGDIRYSLYISGIFEENWTFEQMVAHTQADYWIKGSEYSHYVGEVEYGERLNHPENYSDDETVLPQLSSHPESSIDPATSSSTVAVAG